MNSTNPIIPKSAIDNGNNIAVQDLDDDALSYALLQAQATLREHRNDGNSRGVLILVNGMENAGKGEAVRALTEWMDARYLKVHATVGHIPSLYQPIWQRHTKQLPRNGEVAIYFGNWYADLIHYVFANKKNIDPERLAQMIDDIEKFEQDLINNRTDIIKCWFHVDRETLDTRLAHSLTKPRQLYHINWYKDKQVKRFQQFSNALLSQQSGWQQINGQDIDTSNRQFAQIVLNAINRINKQITTPVTAGTSKPTTQDDTLTHTNVVAKIALDEQSATNNAPITSNPNNVDSQGFKLSTIPPALLQPSQEALAKADYKKVLAEKQMTLATLLQQRGERHIILVFEGMDAAGKGGAIKRIIQALDPREYVIHPIAAPTEDELKHPYLWRFWTRLPYDELADIDMAVFLRKKKLKKCLVALRQQTYDSRLTIFDRSWHGRVLVERIEGFAKPEEWQRAYGEIQRFEQGLSQSGAIIAKFWLAISEEEELVRFKAREKTPNKQYKITDEDWRNRAKWDDYVQAAADMLDKTHSNTSPWHIIATDDKYTARLQVLDALINQLSKQLG